MTTSRRARIGAIDFLNARPLVDGLESHPSNPDVTWAIPSKLAASLRRGDLDLALVPHVEATRDPDYRIVPGPCVSCLGAVESILFFTEKDWHDIERIGVDRASRSSAELLRVLFHLRTGRVPETVEVDSNLDALSTNELDGVLLIGDPALEHRTSTIPRTDLGECWWEIVKLPFVFAVWLGRSGAPPAGIDCVRDVARANASKLEALALDHAAADSRVLDAASSVRYLTRSIRYQLGDEEIRAMQLFAGLRREIGSDVPQDWSPPFFDVEADS